jgi:sulfite reductase (ferredoxin)
MQSFRTELENPVVERDIIDLERKIRLFREGKIHEEKFRSLRLARGVYGQRQKGVQMVRIKLPLGRISFAQWQRLAHLTDEYSTGNLHFTTRQDVQLHFVSLERTPQLWAELEQDDMTLREACGNTVRNVTASATAGVDPAEPFDVTPHALALSAYFLRNPICQELGRKIKIAFSSSVADTGLSFMHDLGFVPHLRHEGGQPVRGFKVVVGGGLGAQPHLATVAHEFLPEDQLIPYTEAVLRVFDRHGERNSRHKARLKFLIQKIGFEAFTDLVQQEWPALAVKSHPIAQASFLEEETAPPPARQTAPEVAPAQSEAYALWRQTNVFAQRQAGYFGVFVNVPLGNLGSQTSRALLAALAGHVHEGDVRITVDQGLFFRFVPAANLPYVYQVLAQHGLAQPGVDGPANITACPGTDTCNLAIANSTALSLALEQVVAEEFAPLVAHANLKIKISGCMNSCGQHGAAQIGFHAASLKSGGRVLPALQVLLGGGPLGNGLGRLGDKVLKVPSRRAPETLRLLLADYAHHLLENQIPNEQTTQLTNNFFIDYYLAKGEKYFYDLLKPLTDLTTLRPADFLDWGHQDEFATEIGVGECAGVQIDLVATLLYEAEEKLDWAQTALAEQRWADAAYHAYAVLVSGAKALLLDHQVACNTQHGIINSFEEKFPGVVPGGFKNLAMQINQHEPTASFVTNYVAQAAAFAAQAPKLRALVAQSE